MSNVKLGLAFVVGWFLCGLLTPHFYHPDDPTAALQLRPPSPILGNTTSDAPCQEKAPVAPAMGSDSGKLSRSAATTSLEASSEEVFVPQTSSRCEFLWDSRCRRPPFKAFDTGKRANTSCLSRLGTPPPVVLLAALPRTGSSLLKSSLEFATGVRVASAAEGQCNARMYSFIESTFPFRRQNVPASCSFWLNKNTRSRPNVGNVWGVVVVVRNPYRWIDDLFDSSVDTLPAAAGNESNWVPFLHRYSHMWRAFVEHWLLHDTGSPLWEQRAAGVGFEHTWEEGPIPETTPRSTPGPRYYFLRYESLVKDPKEAALRILDWAKAVVVPDGSTSTQSRIMERAERCANYGNVVGRMAKAHQEPVFGFGPRFRVTENESSNSTQWETRRVVYDHTMPYLCETGNRPPQELAC